MYEKNQQITAEAQSLGTQGEGVIKADGITFFVPGVLPGEVVRFKILKTAGGIGYGKAEEIIVSAPSRVKAVCPVFGKCGGCQLQHMSYEAQLSLKKDLVQNTLKKIGNIQIEVPIPVPSEKQYGYRNKLQLPVGVNANGETVIGFYAERSHRIVPIDSCAIHPDWATKMIACFQEYIAENGENGYDELRKTGSLRHIVVRDMGGSFIIAVVSRENKLKNAASLIEKLKKVFSEFTLILNVNKRDTNVIFGDKFITLYGSGFFESSEAGVTFEAGAQTFVQINEDIRQKLYERVVNEIAGEKNSVVIDCYSGAGLMTAMAAKYAKRAYGIELSAEAVACADKLKEKNGLKNMHNICGKVEEELFRVLENEHGENVNLILDPPRAGIHRSIIRALLQSGIEKLTLISCNPATLARDLGLLTGALTEDEKGKLVKNDVSAGAYDITFVQPFDMFPQTKHVETLVVLSLKHYNI